MFRSDRSGFTWRLAPDWEFVPVAEISGVPAATGVEMVGARLRGRTLPAVVLIVTELVSVIPGKVRAPQPGDLAELEALARSVMNAAGARDLQTRRVSILGTTGIRMGGLMATAKLHVDHTLAYQGNRKFDFLCYSTKSDGNWPCEEAFAALDVVDQSESRKAEDFPHPLHLRDSRFGVEYDAPDDTWLAIGPRKGLNGAQLVWIWNKAGRQIDVSVLDLAALRGQAADESTLVARMAESKRREGVNVEVKKSELGGRTCSHLEMSKPAEDQQDFFIQKRGNIVYGVLVTSPVRDARLLARARSGLRIRGSESDREGAAQHGVAPDDRSPAAPARR